MDVNCQLPATGLSAVAMSFGAGGLLLVGSILVVLAMRRAPRATAAVLVAVAASIATVPLAGSASAAADCLPPSPSPAAVPIVSTEPAPMPVTTGASSPSSTAPAGPVGPATTVAVPTTSSPAATTATSTTTTTSTTTSTTTPPPAATVTMTSDIQPCPDGCIWVTLVGTGLQVGSRVHIFFDGTEFVSFEVDSSDVTSWSSTMGTCGSGGWIVHAVGTAATGEEIVSNDLPAPC